MTPFHVLAGGIPIKELIFNLALRFFRQLSGTAVPRAPIVSRDSFGLLFAVEIPLPGGRFRLCGRVGQMITSRMRHRNAVGSVQERATDSGLRVSRSILIRKAWFGGNRSLVLR